VNILTLILQKIFFDKARGDPNPRWQQRARRLGTYEELSVWRCRKKLACYVIHPKRVIEAQTSDSNPALVIFSHPISRKSKFFFSDSERAQTYLQRGFSVLAFDYNGFGESDSIDLFYWRDVVAVIDYVKQHYPDQKLVLHGASFGAFHIIRALAHLPQGSEVVLENVNKSLLSYWQKWPGTGRLVKLLEVLRLGAIRDMDVQKVVREFQRSDLHIRFIACEQDLFTTLEEMRELYEQLATDNKSFTIFQGAGHLTAPSKDPELYQTALFSRGCRPC
jgi:hypothetical protein